MQVNGEFVSEVSKRNPIKIEYPHSIKKIGNSANVVAVEMKDNKEIVVTLSMLNSKEDELIIMTSKFGEFEAVEKQAKNFTDVDGSWAKENIDFVTAREIFNGISGNNFAPLNTTTRAEAATAVTNFIKTMTESFSVGK